MYTLAGTPASYELRFSGYYHDDMVLQRSPHKALVWGYVPQSSVSDKITLTLHGTAGNAEYAAEIQRHVKGGSI